MKASELIYADNQGVSLTRLALNIKSNSYCLKIISYRPVVIYAKRLPGLTVLVLGILLSALGYGYAVSLPSLSIAALIMYVGFGMILFGLTTFFMIRERYALQITTSAGVKNVLTSKNQRYIHNLVEKLNAVSLETPVIFKSIQQVA